MNGRTPIIVCIVCERIKKYSDWVKYEEVAEILNKHKEKWYSLFSTCPRCKEVSHVSRLSRNIKSAI